MAVLPVMFVLAFSEKPSAQTNIEVNKKIGSTPTVQNIFTLVNEERAKVGVPPLMMDPRLNESAQLKADDMSLNGFSHTNSDGRNGYDFITDKAPGVCSYVSENIVNPGEIFTAEEAVKDWVESPSHYNAMIDPRYEISGIGIKDQNIVQHFCDIQ